MPALAKSYTVIAPDLRGTWRLFSQPQIMMATLLQKVSTNWYLSWDFSKIFLVAHDFGELQIAYSYAATHSNNVSKLVIMDSTFAGFLLPEVGQNGLWWFAFHQVPNLPEALVQSKEGEYISWFFKGFAYNPMPLLRLI